MDEKSKIEYLKSVADVFSFELMKDKFHTIYIPTVGLLLLIGMIFVAFFKPFPSSYQSSTFGIGIAFFAALGAALIPGYFEFQYKGLVRAGGCLGVFAFVYLVPPKTFSHVSSDIQKKISINLVPHDTSATQTIVVDFDPNSSETISEFAISSVGRYLGSNNDTAYTCYRSSDGLIYSKEICSDLQEAGIIMISNIAQSRFSNKRMAYLYYIKRFR